MQNRDFSNDFLCVTQLVECQAFNLNVTGSIPVVKFRLLMRLVTSWFVFFLTLKKKIVFFDN